MNHRSIFGLSLFLFAGACAQAPVVQSGEEPVPAPDYTQEELATLQQSEQVQRNLEPFGDVPPADASQYVTMPDGVRLALDIYFPSGFDPESTRAPTVYAESWYSRHGEARATAVAMYRRAGFVVV